MRLDKSLISLFIGPQPGADDLIELACTQSRTPVVPDLHTADAAVHGDDVNFTRTVDALDDYERASTFAPNTVDRVSTQHLASPTRTANVRIRRSNYGCSTLSYSPARAGYATRMRQLFEEAGRVDDSPKLYPQLPNISRKASASPSRRPLGQLSTTLPSYRPESLCLATSLPIAEPSVSDAQASLLHPSERSSGSWSDDSGYIVTNSRGRRCSFSVPPKERIYTWLSDISDYEGSHVGVEEQPASIQGQQHQNPADSLHVLLESQVASDDPFVTHDDETTPGVPSQLHLPQEKTHSFHIPRHVSDVCQRLDLDLQNDTESSTPMITTKTLHSESVHLEEGGVQLSPLSPNVCLERGPSRHHSTRQSSDSNIINTPCKDRLYKSFQPGGLKENVVLKQEGVVLTGSPLTARKNILGTRFRRMQ